MGFNAPILPLGIAGEAVVSAQGFLSPLPFFGLSGLAPESSPLGFTTVLPFWRGGIDDSVAEIPPSGGGGGSGPGVGPGDYYNQAPSVRKNEPLYLAQALQEDEELIMIMKAFVETVTWH